MRLNACRGFHAALEAVVSFIERAHSSTHQAHRANIMRLWATSRGTTTTKMAAASTEPIPDASSVSALHDGGPDWEEREKASFDSR